MAKKPRLTLMHPAPTRPNRRASWTIPAGTFGIKSSPNTTLRISGGLEVLTQACQALDRAEALRSEIDRDGEVIRSPWQHPRKGTRH